MDEVRVLETRDLCWSESHSSEKQRRGGGEECLTGGPGLARWGYPVSGRPKGWWHEVRKHMP